MRVTFREVVLTSSKSGLCPICARRATRTQKFFQTVNPFNVNANGVPKGRDEIMGELRAQRDEWKKSPTLHAGCEASVARAPEQSGEAKG